MRSTETHPKGPEPQNFKEMLGISEEEESKEGWARVRMPVKPRHLQKAGVVQGGIIVTLADYAFYRAVSTLRQDGRIGATVELKMNFTAPARGGELIAESQIIHKSGRLVVAHMRVADDDGTLIAAGLGTYTLFNKR